MDSQTLSLTSSNVFKIQPHVLYLKCAKYDNITPALKHHHWLPVRYRIQYKIALITYKTLNDKDSHYLKELLDETPKSRSTRSNNRLKIPRTKLKSAGDRSFSVAAPLVWNSLPVHIQNSTSVKVFKKTI